jgi:hypothetical protein
MKWATMFYSFFSTLYAVQREIVKDMSLSDPSTIMKAAVRFAVIIVAMELANGFIRRELPDLEPEDEDEKGLLAHIATKAAVAMFSGIPLVRDVANGTASAFGFSISPVQGAGGAVVKTIQNVSKWALDEEATGDMAKEVPVATIKAAAITLGVAVGFPAVQFNRMIDAYAAMVNEGRDVTFFDFLTGYDEARAKREGRL